LGKTRSQDVPQKWQVTKMATRLGYFISGGRKNRHQYNRMNLPEEASNYFFSALHCRLLWEPKKSNKLFEVGTTTTQMHCCIPKLVFIFCWYFMDRLQRKSTIKETS